MNAQSIHYVTIGYTIMIPSDWLSKLKYSYVNMLQGILANISSDNRTINAFQRHLTL